MADGIELGLAERSGGGLRRADGSVLGVVLAGGRSRRFGAPKAAQPFLGEMLALRMARTLRCVVGAVVVVTHLPEVRRLLPFPVIQDLVRGAGPLGGLHAALRQARDSGFDALLLVGCDMPFLSAGAMSVIVEEGRARDALVTAPAIGPKRIQPLCAWYRVECLPAVESRLGGSDRSLRGLMDEVGVYPIPRERLVSVCDPDKAFHSVDTPEALHRAEGLAKRSPTGPVLRQVVS